MIAAAATACGSGTAAVCGIGSIDVTRAKMPAGPISTCSTRVHALRADLVHHPPGRRLERAQRFARQADGRRRRQFARHRAWFFQAPPRPHERERHDDRQEQDGDEDARTHSPAIIARLS